MKEFSPLDEFSHLFRTWWLIALFMLLGGLAAYLFHITNPPLYEATATIMATIDLEVFPFEGVREDLIQYNEDLALGAIEGTLRSLEVTQALFTAAQSYGIPLDTLTLAKASTIERKHAIWELRYRSSDPATAQTVVNLWMEIGYQTMQTWQSDGRIAAFVILEDPTPAYLPAEPVAYQLSNLLLAGSAAGFLLGVLITVLVFRTEPTSASPQHD
jgi:uncharacterized protein involved in exopolysaccharide biosynthesis